MKFLPVLNAISNPVTSVIGSIMTNSANKKLAEYSYSKDLEMWNRGNEYNSPEKQMSRLKDAGLNPNLVYGNGAVGNTSGTLPKYQVPRQEYRIDPPNTMETLSQFMDLKSKKLMQDKLAAEIRGQELSNNLNADLYIDKSRYYKDMWGEKTGTMFYERLQKQQNYNWQKGLIDSGLKSDEFAQKLKGLYYANEVKKQQALNYSEQYQGIQIDNVIKDIERKFMTTGGIKGVKDILPLFMQLIRK